MLRKAETGRLGVSDVAVQEVVSPECMQRCMQAASQRLRACVDGDLPLPVNHHEVHVCGLVSESRVGCKP